MDTGRSEYDKEGLDPAWWSKTGSLDLKLKVLEDVIDPELVGDLGLTPPWITPAMRSWFQSVIDRLSEMRELVEIPLNPDLVEAGIHEEKAVLEILICSRSSMDDLLCADGALGLHIIDTPDGDPFREDSAYARVYRIAMVCDEEEFLGHILHEASQDVDPERHLGEYVEAWLNTLFHEIEHVRLFGQNAALNPPDVIEGLSDAGEFGHDIFDCSTGYGIRPLMTHDCALEWANDMNQARHDMEVHVEARGRALLRRVLHGSLGPYEFLEASGLKGRILSSIRSAAPHEPE